MSEEIKNIIKALKTNDLDEVLITLVSILKKANEIEAAIKNAEIDNLTKKIPNFSFIKSPVVSTEAHLVSQIRSSLEKVVPHLTRVVVFLNMLNKKDDKSDDCKSSGAFYKKDDKGS